MSLHSGRWLETIFSSRYNITKPSKVVATFAVSAVFANMANTPWVGVTHGHMLRDGHYKAIFNLFIMHLSSHFPYSAQGLLKYVVFCRQNTQSRG